MRKSLGGRDLLMYRGLLWGGVMPRFEWFLIAVALLLACARSARMPSTSAQEARQLVDAWFAAWAQHAPERIDTIFTDDGIYEDVAGGGVRRGKDEIKQVLAAAFAFAPDFRATLTSLAISGDTVTTQWEIEGTQTGPTPVGSIGELPATGRTFRLRGASVLHLREGRIARVTDYYDMATFWRQLGGTFVAPKPKPAPPT